MTKDQIRPNTESFERDILIAASGFREYDARWLYPEQLNLRGAQTIGLCLGTILHERGVSPADIVMGHDYRSYSASIKHAVALGLVQAGCNVKDIGLALSPVAYFAQYELDCPAVAMITASHNENGWTGIKMGVEKSLTFGPDEMTYLKETVAKNAGVERTGGSYVFIPDMKERYLAYIAKGGRLQRKLKVVAACGNGTAGAYAPEALRAIGCEVIEADCELDYTFPHYNPNPEDMHMLHALSARVKEAGADVGFAFDGDGDRCGFVDNEGEEIFADKVGVMLARYLSGIHKNASFVVDVKSTGLYATDPVLQARGVKTDYWKTGHSYIKRRVHDLNAMAGFEKSGHFFLGKPIGRGYDDSLQSAVLVCRMLDARAGTSLSDLRRELPKTWGSPTMAPYCPDETKYDVVEAVTKIYQEKKQAGETVAGGRISSLVTVNGVRLTLDDGTWGLVRASSNKPSLVVVVESPVSKQRMYDMFNEIDKTLQTFPEIGEYDQKLPTI